MNARQMRYARLTGVFTVLLTSGICAQQSADKAMLTFPILFARQFNYQGLHIYDTFYQWRPGGGIYVLENPADPPDQHRIRAVIDATTTETLGEGIYFDPSLAYDATKVLFSFKGKQNGNSTIYEIGVDGTGLRQITNLDVNGNPYKGSGGGHHDVAPCYLPDGRIVFTSTRYSGLVPCANNGVAILHVMNADGRDIHTISVNNVTEFNPCVLPDGRILFGRWEYIDRNALVIQSLWTVLPDGRNETALYANNMVFPEATLQAKPVPGNDAFVMSTFAPHNAPPRGTIALIDTRVGKNDPAAIINFESPDKPTYDRGESCDPWPLNEHVALFSGIPPADDAPKTDAGGRSNPKLNALMLIDRTGKKVVVHSDPTIDLHNPIPLVPRPVPRVSLDMTDRTKRTGEFFVNDVYVSMPDVKRGTIKWLRVLEETSRVTGTPGGNGLNQTFPISAALAWSAKIYHGIVPVEEDGSVFFEAPSGRALFFQLLDKDYRMVRGMRSFVQASPGVTRSCVGCHEYNPVAQGAPKLTNRKPKLLRPESWGSGWLDYTQRIQPVLDKKCVSCHGGEQGLQGGLDLSRGWTERFNISYESLTARREKMYTADMIGGICGMNGTAYWSCKVFDPYQHGSGKAILADILLSPMHSDILTDMERELFFAWMDSNGMYFGTWDYTKAPPEAEAYKRAVAQIKGVMKKTDCVSCHADGDGTITRFDNWINLDRPEMSLVLRAPLKQSFAAGGGYGLALCRDRKVDLSFTKRGVLYGFGYEHAVKDLDKFPSQKWESTWPTEGKVVVPLASTNEPVYQQMLKIIRDVRIELLAKPRIDMPFADLVGEGIMTGRARQILPQPLPDPLPEITVTGEVFGFTRLTWESSARTIGLIAEVHRGKKEHFKVDAATLIGRTERATFCDTNPPPGKVCYAVVFVSDPAETCGTAKCGAVIDYQHKEEMEGERPREPLEEEGDRCPLSLVKPERSVPVYVMYEPPKQDKQVPIDILPQTESKAGSIALTWPPAGIPGLTCYDVYGAQGRGKPVKLNKEPLRTPSYLDAVFHGMKDTRYSVAAYSPVLPERDRKAPGDKFWAAAKAKPVREEPVFTLKGGGVQLTQGASFDEDGVLTLTGEGYAKLPPLEELTGGAFSFVLEVMFDEAGAMPVLLGFGKYMGDGWFFQRIGGGWRFHLSGISCDGGTVEFGKWTRLVGTFDGTTARLYQDGKNVGEKGIPEMPPPFKTEWRIGQYVNIEPPYQVHGKIRLLEVYSRVLPEK
ncbi:MAG: hypothetical protein FWH21_04410 [Kiritimatiellaeota bacterium]|nr:hypothetical protein [Kiritimatiellota bacterium]